MLKSIIDRKLKETMPEPTEEEWKSIAEKFYTRWNFPMCTGAIDGKHVRIQCPGNSGSLYYNYKNFFSNVLFALVDADYKFIGIDVGSYGRESDAGIFNKCALGKKIRDRKFAIPPPAIIQGTNIEVPYVFLGDQAFALKSNMMIPYPQKKVREEVEDTMAIFNIRHTRARRVVENAFGILNNVWRIFNTPINVQPEVVDKIIVVSCILHNMLRQHNVDITPSLDDCEMQMDEELGLVPLLPLQHLGRQDVQGTQIRNKFRSYFVSAVGTISLAK